MHSVTRLTWRWVSPWDNSILLTCLRNGQHVDPEQVIDHGYTLRDANAVAIKKATRKWENEAGWYTFFAIIIFLPWGIAAWTFSTGY